MKDLFNEIMAYAAKSFDVVTRLDIQYNVNTTNYSARVWFASGKVVDFEIKVTVVEDIKSK